MADNTGCTCPPPRVYPPLSTRSNSDELWSELCAARRLLRAWLAAHRERDVEALAVCEAETREVVG